MNLFILQNAVTAQRNKQYQEAVNLYQQFLHHNPNHAEGWHLFGSLLGSLGQFQHAIPALLNAKKVGGNDPNIVVSLVDCYLKAEKFTDASHQLQQFKSSFGELKEYHLLTAKLLESQGKLSEAIAALQTGIHAFPNEYAFYYSIAEIHNQVEDYPQAIWAYQKALELKPGSLVCHHNLGICYRLDGKPAHALEHYQVLLNANHVSFQLFHNVGNAYSDLGDLEKGIHFFERALQLNLGYLETHQNLNDLYWETNQTELFLTSYLRAMAEFPTEFVFVSEYCKSLMRITQYQQALTVLEERQTAFSNDNEYWYLIAKAKFGLEQSNEALNAIDKVNSATLSIDLMVDIGELLVELKAYDKAKPLLQKAVDTDPYNQAALAYLGCCWRKSHDERLPVLNNYDDLVQEFQLFDTDNNAEDQAYIADLIAFLRTLHSAEQQPLNQTLMEGTQTRGSLFDVEDVLITKLTDKIKWAIGQYVNKASEVQTPWYPDLAKSSFKFSGSWSVLLKEEGFHSNHFHSMGTLSSVIYLKLPSSVKDQDSKQGWLKFGEPNLKDASEFPPDRFVQPVVGKLVLFPSYAWHGTVPFTSNEERMTIAFDVKF